ncbi:DUF4276 family protein [Thioalkalivibrio sp. XN8]|nr:DUF4276 family protein [Thioalkalivibrio sp. XN8]
MTLGIVVDGRAESQAWAPLVDRLCATLGVTVCRPVYADMQPRATPPQVARAALSRIQLLRQRGAQRIVVLIDRDDSPICPGEFARDLEAALDNLGSPASVVVKDQCFENWLVADPSAFRAMPSRFAVTQSFERSVAPNRADNADALRLINRITIRREYDKSSDAHALCKHAEPARMAANSRSFRRFLRLLGHPDFESQSRRPARQ